MSSVWCATTTSCVPLVRLSFFNLRSESDFKINLTQFMDAVKNLLFSFLRRFLESIDITSVHFLVDTSELFSIISCFTVLFPSSNSCDTNIANYAYVRRFICRIVYILSFFLFSLIDNSLHNYAEILSDFARICRKRRFLSLFFCWNSLKRD